ncbi:MAG TPA: type VI secretion system tip protein TssI/VgrG [Aliidongia sp.]|uniref:type VI secretion system Vgr family protein n=1 Tax=Aliidongia sp. TaxID=1914230 RepID=UPI002DDD3E69|nr:type VI secretion system tip protein TssI/VgrG [Aliidongia sp.]HEV2675035.1 type VI secretion system tip protein TssI/VgrG [Aliidongia sp.]
MTSTLGDDVLLLQRMSGMEQMSGLFEFTLDLLSTNHSITAKDLLGTSLTVSVDLQDLTTRYFNGLAVRFAHTGGNTTLSSYRVTLRPWLWFLTRWADCRIFQDLAVPDIILKIFRDAGFTDITNSLSKTYSPRDYCVQYRETSFDFVSRLMESEGIYYYFTHDTGKHTLVLADGYGAHSTAPSYDSVPYYPPDESGRRVVECLDDLSISNEIRSGQYTQRDYNFQSPSLDLTSTYKNALPYAHADGEIYDYPGGYMAMADGDPLSRVHLEELESQYELYHGHGDARGLGVGRLFTLTDHPVDTYNQEYLITASSYTASAAAYTTGEGAEDAFACSITATKGDLAFRPSRATPRAVMRGPQTALVVGKSGEEIWTDSFGRIKVQFYWDRLGKKDENSSCWLRVSQLWAGASWGAMFLPRIGQEVIVDFLEGDPDRPIVTGRVYNGTNTVPYALPANQTQSTIKSNSSKGGGGSNEMRFEDKKGSEEVYMHAQKDFNTVVENDDSLKVGHDQTIDIKNNRTEVVEEGDETITVKQGNRAVTIKTGDETLTVETGNRKTQVNTGNNTLTVDTGNNSTTVTTGNNSLTVSTGNNTTKVSTGNYTIDVGTGKMSITATAAIELTCGGSSIKIEPTQITISSVMIKVDGSAQTEVSGAMTKVAGSGMLQLQGGITMIG